MGCFDSILVPCPKCGELSEFQTKGGECLQRTYTLGKDIIPDDVMGDVNRHAPYTCMKCGTRYAVDKDVFTKIVLAVKLTFTAKPVTWPHFESLEPPSLMEDVMKLNDWPPSFHPGSPIDCAHCTHWQPSPGSIRIGACRLLSHFQGRDSLVDTEANFGCLKFSPRDDATKS